MEIGDRVIITLEQKEVFNVKGYIDRIYDRGNFPIDIKLDDGTTKSFSDREFKIIITT